MAGVLAAACLAGCAGKPVVRASAPAAVQADLVLHNALPAAIRESGVLQIATDASYAPASSFAADGHTIVGFEPDLGTALGEVLGVRVRFVNHAFSSLSAMVADGKTDLVMSAMTDTVQREEKVDFVDYFTAGSSIVVQRGNPTGLSDLASLCGHVVALEAGTVQVDLVQRVLKNCPPDKPITVHLFKTNTDTLVQLRTGRADAVLNDYPPAAALVTDARTGAFYQLASTAQYEPGPYGIAASKSQPQLRDAVAQALRTLVADGRYAQILAKWGVGAGAVKYVSLNGGAAS
ncbi:ABC transporter substrate-binding protein [Jatrophihabitans telluris]|uniref:ABC transporter substrate-binding protein n=1 Tax=Jatrophihabitans telluris TaxID=2038343 RepID=A0ABY4R1U5_9ACTN|nr:ABC transporter substrate-binding protein [Jatrophihabitans telluris]UQX89768.1 ABC transporter substrate-binding protein [Jatrophihabitans telluris]